MNPYRIGSISLALVGVSLGFAQRLEQIDQTCINVKLAPSISGGLIDGPLGATEVSNRPQIGWRTVKLPANVSIQKAIAYYRKSSGVLAAEPRFLHDLDLTPNDPRYSVQYAPQITRSNLAWDLTRGAPKTVIAILDTGIDFTHPEFQGNKLVKGIDVSNNDNDPTDDLDFNTYANHGIHCSGIAAAGTNNGVGIAGTGFNCAIMPVKVFPNSFADVISKGIIYAADNGAKVISMSLGSYSYSQEMQDAVTYAFRKNVVVLASAGNDNVDTVANPHYPSDYVNVVSTGSTDRNDRKSDFSNFGKRVDIAAPGSDILSTFAVANGSYGELSGTSMATPAVAGIIGLVWSYAPPGTKNTEIISAMKKTSVNVGNWLSNGRIDAYKLVNYFTVSTPVPATLVAKSIFQGTAATGTGAYMNVRSVAVRGTGHVAGVTTTFKMPPNPIGQLRKSTISTTFTSDSATTVQLFIWNYSTGKYDLLNSVVGSTGRITYTVDALPSQYYDKNTRNFTVILRALLPSRSGNPSNGFVLPVNSFGATFNYSTNP